MRLNLSCCLDLKARNQAWIHIVVRFVYPKNKCNVQKMIDMN